MSDGPITETVQMDEEHNVDSSIQTEAQVRSESDKYNSGTMQKQLIHEEHNTAYNHPIIVQRLKAGTARDLADEPKVDKTPALILFSGGSLDRDIKFLPQWKGGIFCSTSHALTLMRYGIEPTHIVALDPFCTWDEIKGVDWSKTRTKLITQPGVWPTLIENWPNDMLLFRQNIGRQDSFYATTQKHMFTERTGFRNDPKFDLLIRTEITMLACTPPAQMFAADKLGYGNIFLVGADLGFVDNKDRFTNWTVKKEGRTIEPNGNYAPIELEPEWEANEHPFDKDEKKDDGTPVYNDLIVSNSGMLTSGYLLYYKKNVVSGWRLSKQQTWITSKEGILAREMPYVSMSKVIKTQGDMAPYPENWIIKTSERYLASVGAFVIWHEEGPGLNFVECKDPEIDLHNYMVNARRQFVCPVCQLAMGAPDETDHAGEKCPRCKQGDFKRANEIDIDKNMKRIRGYLGWAREKQAEMAAEK